MNKNIKRELVRVNINLLTTIVRQVKENSNNNGINVTTGYITLIK